MNKAVVRSLRSRLTVWYALALGISLLAFATAVWAAAWQSLHNEVDQALEQQMVNVRSFLSLELRDPKTRLPEELSEYAQALPGNVYMNVSQNRSSLFDSTPDFPWAQPRRGRSVAVTLHWRNQNYAVLSRTISLEGKEWNVNFAHSLGRTEEILRRLFWLLVALIPAAIALASVGGVWLSRKALRPVDQMTEAAREIGLQDLSTRLLVPQTGDELQRLAETWNGMLARLEEAVSRLTRFTADAAHELRTPIAVIRSTAEIAGRRSRSEDAYRKAFASISQESDQMTALLDDLLFLARSDAGHLELPMLDFDLDDLVSEVKTSMQPIAEAAGITFVCVSARNAVHGNRSAIRRLLFILVDNAVKYSRPGGSVRVEAKATADDEVELQISDQGHGIPQAELPFVFDRFYRGANARERGQGAGLGLALAKGIAKLHRSRLEVVSTSPQGTVFGLSLATRQSQAGLLSALSTMEQPAISQST